MATHFSMERVLCSAGGFLGFLPHTRSFEARETKHRTAVEETCDCRHQAAGDRGPSVSGAKGFLDVDVQEPDPEIPPDSESEHGTEI